MNCPNCNNEINAMNYCPHCGYQINNLQNNNQANIKPQRQRLILNGIYSVYLFLLTVIYPCLAVVSFFAMMDTMSFIGVICTVTGILLGVISLLMGILLWKRKKVGCILAIINNSLHTLSGLLVSAIGTYLIGIGIFGTGDLDGLGLVLGIPALIYGLLLLIMSIIFLVYYIVNRKHFN